MWCSPIRSFFISRALGSFLVDFKPISLELHGIRNFSTVYKFRQIQNQSHSTDLDYDIANLKVEIEGYVNKLNDPGTSEARKDLLLQTINASRETLNKLLDQKKSFLHVVDESKGDTISNAHNLNHNTLICC